MAEIILDIGSGRSLHNVERAEAMLEAVANMDSHKHKIVFKAQLFQDAPPNVPLDHWVFGQLYEHAAVLGYELTASVFDKESLDFLLLRKVPFVKIACRPDLHHLIDEIPRKIPVYLSYDAGGPLFCVPYNTRAFACIPKYPATIDDYNECRRWFPGMPNISDHTVGWDMFKQYNPICIEKHLCPEREADNPDSGPFAVTPEELREVIG